MGFSLMLSSLLVKMEFPNRSRILIHSVCKPLLMLKGFDSVWSSEVQKDVGSSCCFYFMAIVYAMGILIYLYISGCLSWKLFCASVHVVFC